MKTNNELTQKEVNEVLKGFKNYLKNNDKILKCYLQLEKDKKIKIPLFTYKEYKKIIQQLEKNKRIILNDHSNYLLNIFKSNGLIIKPYYKDPFKQYHNISHEYLIILED